MNISNRTKRILQIIGFGWASLGFYRGTQEHNYDYQNNLKKYNDKMIDYHKSMEEYNTSKYYIKPSLPEKPHKYYLTSLLKGCVGVGMYCNPFLAPMYILKEIYRFERYLRNMDDQANESYYNKL